MPSSIYQVELWVIRSGTAPRLPLFILIHAYQLRFDRSRSCSKRAMIIFGNHVQPTTFSLYISFTERYFKFRLGTVEKNAGGKWANKGSVCFPRRRERKPLDLRATSPQGPPPLQMSNVTAISSCDKVIHWMSTQISCPRNVIIPGPGEGAEKTVLKSE